ncbi:MAG: triose-phosphate isomerase [Candidatus Firestonebacteria bacterium RIFOXYC2_FULL_39_67]|nr:MAG: triose-phosphate isomerase [Candidatus Firestonebacteria bacterium RIFOXYD2_FULL_39_29]OGF53717.1 MAG: triose-phosphate isomerase [Candidatus Firestonebacteria bacterium RIFOXYC2_FULL_39_67]
MRKAIIAGNWKMNKTVVEALELVKDLRFKLEGVSDVEVVVCPPFLAVYPVYQFLKGSNIKIGAQNCYFEKKGAFTGEVSPSMLKEAGCTYVILGHSERRQYFKETNEFINKKVKAVLAEGLLPIICVGETLEEREKNIWNEVIKTQVTGCLSGFTKEEVSKMVLAYEPVWAIGTGKVASKEQAQEVHKFIRGLVEKLYDKPVAEAVRIQYGGSVKPDNVSILMSEPDIDGALVGGAALEAESFVKLVKFEKK